MGELFQNILTASFHGSLVILAILLFRPLMKKGPKKFLCLLWLLAFLRLILPFELQSSLSLQPHVSSLPQISQKESTVLPSSPKAEINPGPAEENDPLETAATPLDAPASEALQQQEGNSVSALTVFGGIWLCVFSLFLIFSVLSYAHLRLSVRDAIRTKDAWESERIETAFILGFLRPRIYIPMGMDPVTRKYILAHEHTHLEKGDPSLKLFGYVTLALHWFNPLVWAAYLLLCKDIELACDERVVQFMDLAQRKAYSSALLACSANRIHLAACPVAFGEVSVKERIKAVLHYKKPAFWISIVCVIAIIFVIVCLMTSPQKTPENPETIPVTTEESIAAEPDSAEEPINTEVTEPAQLALLPDAEAVSVSTVDEFLSALGSNKKITLTPGTYDLTTASDYGRDAAKDAGYTWVRCDDGYQLTLKNLQKLAILGSGQAQTQIITAPRHAEVMQFNDCQHIYVKDLTIGHTEGGEMCSGSVIDLYHCQDAELKRLGLYGCGTVGVKATETNNLTVNFCEIYECSHAGIAVDNSRSTQVFGTHIHNIQKNPQDEFPARAALSFYNTAAVTVEGCIVEDSEVANLLYSIGSNVTITDTFFRGNHLLDAAFWMEQGKTVFARNTYRDNEVRNWYKVGGEKAMDPEGKEIPEEVFEPLLKETTSETSQDSVTASTIDELLAAIAPNREIILDGALYDLSTAGGYGKTQSEYFYWNEGYDGPELIIQNVDNLTIRSADGEVKAHTISAVPRYANVLKFNQCTNVTLQGFTAGHTKEPGHCAGGVIYFENCDQMTVDNCGLFGCGILGVQAAYSENILVENSEIYECSYGGIRMDDSENIAINGCTFRDLGGPVFLFPGCQNVTIDGAAFDPHKNY